ncbi:hypothetical protein B0H17DRAFT_1146525 [Mycena rosella]|uniref:Uncharacterized protein n=1 Tax=Mycena rosella TaxID=1033263 RepID=A0AAD7CNU4_MYCRO|nr:hypothetical protein B0H17DRAFT_1146525 [Mycena rosella]
MSFAPPLHPNVQLSTKLSNFYFNRRDGNHLSSAAVCDVRIETGRESVKFKCMFTQKEAEHKLYIIGNYKFKCSANRAARNQPEVGDEQREVLSDIGPWLPQFSLNDPWCSTGTLLVSNHINFLLKSSDLPRNMAQDEHDLTADEVPFDPAAYIRKGKKISTKDIPNAVASALAQVLKLPAAQASLIPDPNLPVAIFLELPLPKKSSAIIFSAEEDEDA